MVINKKADITWIKQKYPDVEWKDNLTTIGIELGEKIG